MVDINYRNGIKRLLDEYEGIINESVKKGFKWREKIERKKLSDEDQQELLKEIIEQILIQGRGAEGVETQINKIEKRIEKWSIENVEKNLNNMGMSDRKKQKLKEILEYLKSNSISEWIIRLDKGDHIPRMGLKSDDDFLKEHGFYEHIPVDRHTQRFLFRTGIIHWYLKRNNDDVLTLFGSEYNSKYKLFRKIIVAFCREFCNDINISSPKGELNLAENPGILDIILWRHGRNICGNKPSCNECVFREVCLWYLLR